MNRFLVIAVLLCVAIFTRAQSSQPALIVTTEPNAIVWIDEVRRGTTDPEGRLSLAKLTPGRHTLRVRAAGFKETVMPLLPGRRTIAAKLITTTDKAELMFQQAETARDEARDER